ncbi:MAG: DUF4340 domain-containing protein [Ignavibacteriae bacterium]|nr:DUF4340 domain-containing protein [Ignavibacteriota bacterium]
MKAKKTYILVVVFIALVVIAYFLTTDRGERTATYKLEKQLFAVDSASVDKLEIEQNGKKITLVKAGIEWRVSQPVDYTAYQQFVAAALSDLKKYKLESKVSDNPNNKDKYGFNDTSVVKVTVYQGGNMIGVILVGNVASGPGQSFIKKSESNEIFLANDFLRSNFSKDNMLNDWRDKLICAIPKGNIKSVEFISSSENYKIEKDSAGFYRSGKDSVNNTVADGIFNIFQNFNTIGFKDSTIGENVKFDYTIKIMSDRIYEINFLKAGEGSNPKYILKVSDKKQLFEVDENFVKMVFKGKKEMLVSK